MERNDYIHIFNKFLENKATPSEIKLLIEWLKERKAFDTWADDIWMQSPMEMDPSVKQHLLDELRKQIFFKETGKRTFMSLSLPSLFHYALRITAIILLLITTSIVNLVFPQYARVFIENSLFIRQQVYMVIVCGYFYFPGH